MAKFDYEFKDGEFGNRVQLDIEFPVSPDKEDYGKILEIEETLVELATKYTREKDER